MCYNQVKYSNDMRSAQVTAACRKHSSITQMEYNFAGKGFDSSDSFTADSSLGDDALTLQVRATDGNGKQYTITVEPSNFVW